MSFVTISSSFVVGDIRLKKHSFCISQFECLDNDVGLYFTLHSYNWPCQFPSPYLCSVLPEVWLFWKSDFSALYINTANIAYIAFWWKDLGEFFWHFNLNTHICKKSFLQKVLFTWYIIVSIAFVSQSVISKRILQLFRFVIWHLKELKKQKHISLNWEIFINWRRKNKQKSRFKTKRNLNSDGAWSVMFSQMFSELNRAKMHLSIYDFK